MIVLGLIISIQRLLFSVLILMTVTNVYISSMNSKVFKKINRVAFMGDDISLVCPHQSSFYEWKKIEGNKEITLDLENSKQINIKVPKLKGPIIYKCSSTGGSSYRQFTIRLYPLNRTSSDVKIRCYVEPKKQIPNYPCFIHPYKPDATIKSLYGSKLSLDCEVGIENSNQNLITYTWYKEFSAGKSKELLEFKNKPILTIPSLNKDNVGMIMCVGHYKKRNVSRSYKVEILKMSRDILVHNGKVENKTFNIQDKYELTCNVSSTNGDKLSITWGYKISDKEPVMISNKSKLFLKNGVKHSRLSLSLELMKKTKHFICFIITDKGGYQQKDFYVNVVTDFTKSMSNPSSEYSLFDQANQTKRPKSRFFYLWILIPSLIIAACIITGIFITIKRYRRTHNKYHHPNSNTQNKQFNRTLVTPQQLHQQPQLQHSYTKYDSGSNSINTTKSGVPDAFHMYDYQNNNNNNNNAFNNNNSINKQNCYLQQQQVQQIQQQQNMINPTSQNNIPCYSSSGSEKMMI